MTKINDEELGGNLEDAPNEKYKKFFEKFPEINTLKITDWKPVHLLSYFCKKYYETYHVKYQFKFNSPAPSKCFEVFQIKKLASMLTARPDLLKEYIDWVFVQKVQRSKRRLTSISFMTGEDIIKEYKLDVLLADQKPGIERSTSLSEKFKAILKESGYPISTYGELAFLSQASDMSFEVTGLLIRLEAEGLDTNMLSKIK